MIVTKARRCFQNQNAQDKYVRLAAAIREKQKIEMQMEMNKKKEKENQNQV